MVIRTLLRIAIFFLILGAVAYSVQHHRNRKNRAVRKSHSIKAARKKSG